MTKQNLITCIMLKRPYQAFVIVSQNDKTKQKYNGLTWHNRHEQTHCLIKLYLTLY